MTLEPGARRGVWLFFLFLTAYAFSWAFWIPDALASRGVALPAALERFLDSPYNPAAFGPLLAAVVASLREGGTQSLAWLLRRGVEFRFRKAWLLAALLVPPPIFGGAILLATWLGEQAADRSVVSNPAFALAGFFVIFLTAGPLQEEFGWRGFALPRLQARHSALAASLITGLVWWLWHLPLAFIPGKFMVGSLPLFLALGVETVLAAVLFTWIFNNTNGSVLACMLFHASMNWSIWVARPSMRVDFPVIACTVALLAVAVAVVTRVWGAARLSRAAATPA